MQRVRYIFLTLFILYCRGLSAQEYDLYDFRYYRLFSSEEELREEEKRDSITTAKFLLDKNFSTRSLDYNLSAVRFARRGVQSFKRATTLNGVELPFVSNRTIRALQLSANYIIGISRNSFEGELSLKIDTLQTSRTSAGFAFSSRNTPYSITLSTSQKLSRGWAISADIDARTGRDLHIEGLFGNSLSISAIAIKQFNKKHLLSMAIFAKPSMRSTRQATTAEAFRLIGNNLYNPSWGYQNGKIRNARIRRTFLPTAFVGYEGSITKQTQLSISASVTAGVEKFSSLDWFDAQTPLPDNYRYLPSYFNDEDDIFSMVESAWISNNTNYTQINFDNLIATNRLNGDEAVYAISDRVRRIIDADLRAEATTTFGKHLLSYGVEIKHRNRRNYKQMRDLLGAKYIIDIDYYLLDDDTYGNSLQNDLNNPNRLISEGDKYGYDYFIKEQDISIFGTYHYSTERLNIDLAAKVGYCDISRRGGYRKELFAENSYGESRHLKFSPYALRIAAEYLIAENHFVSGTLATESESVDGEDLFLQSQYNNRIIDSPSMSSKYGAELRYLFQKQNFALNASLFLSAELNDTRVRHIYDDLSGEYVDIVESEIDYLRYGIELEAEYRFANHFRATAAFTAARYTYADNARITIYSDASNALLADHITSYTKGLSLGNAPQIAVTAGLSYYNRGWWAAINANYAGLRFVEPSEVMRTERVLAMATSSEQRNTLTTQEKLRDAFTIDISLSKSLYINRLSRRIYSTKAAPRFEDRYPRSRLIFRVGVRNLLGSTNIVYNAYESSRLQRYKLAGEYIYNRQATRYLYAYSRTFYASATFAF